jgi:hypothetical protein
VCLDGASRVESQIGNCHQRPHAGRRPRFSGPRPRPVGQFRLERFGCDQVHVNAATGSLALSATRENNVLIGLNQQACSNFGHGVEDAHAFLNSGRKRNADHDALVLPSYNSCTPSGLGIDLLQRGNILREGVFNLLNHASGLLTDFSAHRSSPKAPSIEDRNLLARSQAFFASRADTDCGL